MKKILVAALLLLTTFAAMAQTAPDTTKQPVFPKMPDVQKGVYVTDFTHTLTDGQVENLTHRCAEIYQKTKFELVIVIMDALPKGIDVDDATVAVDEKWSPGDDPNAERLIYIAGLKQHGHRITAARGTKSSVLFSKAQCTTILTAMRPDYDKHDYYAGLQIMVDQVSARLHIDTGGSSLTSTTNIYIGAVVLAVILILFTWFRSKQNKPAA